MNVATAYSHEGALLSPGNGFLGSIKLNPLDLPPYTIRLRYKNGETPVFEKGVGHQVSVQPNVWDLTTALEDDPGDWSELVRDYVDDRYPHLQGVLSANSSGVTNMTNMFSYCDDLKTVPLFDTSSVTTMQGMFQWCTSLEQVPLYDTSNVTDTAWMFLNCHSLVTVPPLNTSKVTYTAGMFLHSVKLQKVPLFDMSHVTDMHEMFAECYSLSEVPLFDTSNVVIMGSAFHSCHSLRAVPLLNTSSIVDSNIHSDFTSVFAYCESVESGALDLYRQISTQPDAPTDTRHAGAFRDCGINTPSGYAELQEIPFSYGGLKVP